MHTYDKLLRYSVTLCSDARGCDYQGHEFGAPYPDSVCVDGYLCDADSCDEPGGPLSAAGDIPCPHCNHEEWVASTLADIENAGANAFVDGLAEKACPFPAEARFVHLGARFREAWLKGWRGADGAARRRRASRIHSQAVAAHV